MKPPRSNGFTLIEMLTVITIIALLIALLFPTIRSALRKGEITEARIEIKTIAHAVQAFYNEYGYLPCSAGNTITTSGPLCTGTTGPNGNTHGIIFLTPPTRKGALDSSGTFLDPWGNAYQVVYDCNYQGNVSVNSTTVYAPVGVYSYGPDATSGSLVINSQSIFSYQ